ncbi:hypothetical protein M569_07402 [Genlisea aurea]|uniref:Transcription factor CBF/NF-Y/archaeal histone domain-containing protein n=1 Tax=Genlisea aurea TaxID=192259 RepID=S8DW41_9LAMI|nr:hypothetical protein M569_07402 [Genlisea aurea]
MTLDFGVRPMFRIRYTCLKTIIIIATDIIIIKQFSQLQHPHDSRPSHPSSPPSSTSRGLRFDSMADYQGAPGSPAGGSHESGGDQSPRGGVREQDRFLPIANISRIMKKALPANGKIAKDAKETVQECVSEFISFITSEASDKCQREKRKTINGDDLLWAMATLGFEDYIDPLKVYLNRYREMEGDSKGSGKSGDGSSRKDGIQQAAAAQGSFSQGIGYVNSQRGGHMMVPMRGGME